LPRLPKLGKTYCQNVFGYFGNSTSNLATILATGNSYIWQIWQQNRGGMLAKTTAKKRKVDMI